MGNCILCSNKNSEDDSVCIFCGYDQNTNRINDFERCKAYYRKIISRTHHWSESVKFLGRIEELLRCSQSHMAEILKISKAKVSTDLVLARRLKENPELERFSSKKKAQLYSDKPYKDIFESEEKLQRYLYNNWEKTPFSKDWSLIKSSGMYGKHLADEMGEMDLLAQNKDSGSWLVIELKQDKSSDETVGQILRYMGWVKKNKAKENDEVLGLIVCGSFDKELRSALICVPFIRAQVYRKSDKKLKFLSFDEAEKDDAISFFKSLPPEEQQKLINRLEKTRSSYC
jgi:Endonuclease NucS C-terminal domain